MRVTLCDRCHNKIDSEFESEGKPKKRMLQTSEYLNISLCESCWADFNAFIDRKAIISCPEYQITKKEEAPVYDYNHIKTIYLGCKEMHYE